MTHQCIKHCYKRNYSENMVHKVKTGEKRHAKLVKDKSETKGLRNTKKSIQTH